MADEQLPPVSEQITGASPPDAPAATTREAITPRIVPGPVPPTLANGTATIHGENPFYRPMGQLVVGWIAAIVAFLVAANVLKFLLGLCVVYGLGLEQVPRVVGWAAVIATYILFVYLDRDFWLSRVFGLQTGPRSSPLRTVLYYLIFGLAGLARQSGTPRARPQGSRAGALPQPPPASEPKDVFREVAETVVFVVVLVLLLKTFVAEAFVIPTGSMATTLWGYQKVVTCPECGEVFPVNCSNEVNPQNGRSALVVNGCVCPNCRKEIAMSSENDPNAAYHAGDRVLVAKFLYDTGIRPPRRDDVVVFKYPVAPQQNNEAINYIKRLVGLPGETVAIYRGKLYVTRGLDYRWRDPPPGGPFAPLDPNRAYTTEVARTHPDIYENDDQAHQWFKKSLDHPDLAGRFEIVRKSPDVILSMSRLVYDNDHQARDQAGKPAMQRWQGNDRWKTDDPLVPRRFDHSGEMSWLRYRHVLRDDPGKPQLITDFMGYNTGYNVAFGRPSLGQNWVGDLILECDVETASANPGDEVAIELAKGPDRFQARFDLSNGDCRLIRRRTVGQLFEKVLASKPGTALHGTGKHHVRLANVDDRLTLWVDGDLPFGDGIAYEAAKDLGPDRENDLQPAAIGVKGKAAVAQLLLRRDTYYTVDASQPDAPLHGDPNRSGQEPWADPDAWGPLRERHCKTLFVQPNHYLCLGDNSPESADGRTWGLVPERLLLGRALVVYFPFYPFGPVTRVGPIK